MGAVTVALHSYLGMSPPRTPARVANGDVAIVWSGRGQWLLMQPHDARTATDLAQTLAGLASLTDQSDARVHLRLAGPDVRNALAKLVMLDLHPAGFPVGAAAMTVLAHMPVHIWRLPDGDSATFVVAGPQSYATSLWHHIVTAAAEYGLDAQVLG